jgi:hypothetical protein
MTTKGRRLTAATDLSGRHALAKRPGSGDPYTPRDVWGGFSVRENRISRNAGYCATSGGIGAAKAMARQRAIATPALDLVAERSSSSRTLSRGGVCCCLLPPVAQSPWGTNPRKPASGAGPAGVHRVLHTCSWESVLARCPCLRRSAAGWLRFAPPSRRHRTRGCREPRKRTGRRSRATTTDRRRRLTAGPRSRRDCRR